MWPDLADRRAQRALAYEHPVAAVAPGEPHESEPLAVVLEELSRR